MIAVVAYLLVVGTLVAVAARAAEEALRITGRPTRWAWVGAFLVLGAVASWAALREPTLTVPVTLTAAEPAAAVTRQLAPDGPLHALTATAARALGSVGELPGRLTVAVASALPPSASRIAALTWLAMSAALLALLALAYLRFMRAVRRLPSHDLHGERVHVSPASGPAVVGIARPMIVIPAWLLQASDDEQHLALTHEREHLAARDPLLLLAACVAVAVLPWHPAAWWMLARLRLAVETDCDHRVLARGIPRRTYGLALIDIAARCTRLPVGVAALADPATQLERRLIAMTPAPISLRRTRALGLAAAAILVTAAACEARLPSATEIDGLDVAAVEQNRMTRTALGSDTTKVYFVDGRQATSEEARAIAPEQIASIEVEKNGAPGTSSIRITTRAAADASKSESASLPAKAQLRVATEEGSTRSFTGLVLVDGVKVDDMPALPAASIQSMEVIKGAAATQRYKDPAAANGVILVTTKKP